MTTTHTDRQVSASRVIAADAQALFDVVADPSLHHVIDGSGSVKGARGETHKLALGDTFSTNMRIGVPYFISNKVVEYTEGRRIAALAEAHQLELAPHCWGSALSFSAGVNLAFSSSAARTIEYSLGSNPLLRELPEEDFDLVGGTVQAPTGIGFGVTPRSGFLDEYGVTS